MRLSAALSVVAFTAATVLTASVFTTRTLAAEKAQVPHEKTVTVTESTGAFKDALAEAKASGKLLLLDFGGSTWCPTCVLADREIFAAKEFHEYAGQKLVVLKVDFPDPVIQIDASTEWMLKYLPPRPAMPVIVLVAADGKEIGKLQYAPGGAKPFIAEIEKLAKK